MFKPHLTMALVFDVGDKALYNIHAIISYMLLAFPRKLPI